MPSKSRSKTITWDPNWLGPAVAPGEILLEEFPQPLELGQLEAARRLEISLNRLNEIVLGKRGITAERRSGSRASQDLATVLDAAPGRLGPVSSDVSGRQGLLVARPSYGSRSAVSGFMRPAVRAGR